MINSRARIFLHGQFYKYYKDFPLQEVYFFELLRNEFILNDLGPKKISMYIDFGVGYTSNAKLIDSNTELK